MLLLPESALLLIGGRFYRPLQVTDIWLFDLQCLNRVDKLAHAHRTRQEVFLILKHHVIAEILARCCAPRLTECDFLPAVIIFQMFALSFRTDELAAMEKAPLGYAAKIRAKIETLLEAHYRETFEKWLETERIVCKPYFRLRPSIHPATYTDIYARSLYAAEDGDMNKLEQKLIVELTALPNVRWWHRNIARQDFAINGFIKHYPDILIMTQSGKLICAETKGEHLKNDDSREKIALGQAWRTAAGKDFRYYMVFENDENLLPGAVSMSQFIDTVKAL